MLLGFDHVGITCSNMEKTVAFYRDLLGFREFYRARNSAGTEVVFLDAGGGMLELFMPNRPVKTPAAADSPDQAGFRHISLRVDNLDEMYTRLCDAGVKFRDPPKAPNISPTAKKLAFCFDPDGVLVELMECRETIV